jgi:fluoroquinolone resistance protein
MNQHYDTSFEKIDFAETPFVKGEYENCTFIHCLFPETALSGSSFSECTFTGCNLSLSKLAHTAFKDIAFKDCKLMGVRFENCSDFLFEVAFDDCMLNLSSFYKRNLKKTHFNNCSLREVDFASADLSNAVFNNCDLAGTIFDSTILEKADLRTAVNYTIHPESNRISKAKFSVAGLPGLLYQYKIDISY